MNPGFLPLFLGLSTACDAAAECAGPPPTDHCNSESLASMIREMEAYGWEQKGPYLVRRLAQNCSDVLRPDNTEWLKRVVGISPFDAQAADRAMDVACPGSSGLLKVPTDKWKARAESVWDSCNIESSQLLKEADYYQFSSEAVLAGSFLSGQLCTIDAESSLLIGNAIAGTSSNPKEGLPIATIGRLGSANQDVQLPVGKTGTPIASDCRTSVSLSTNGAFLTALEKPLSKVNELPKTCTKNGHPYNSGRVLLVVDESVQAEKVAKAMSELGEMNQGEFTLVATTTSPQTSASPTSGYVLLLPPTVNGAAAPIEKPPSPTPKPIRTGKGSKYSKPIKQKKSNPPDGFDIAAATAALSKLNNDTTTTSSNVSLTIRQGIDPSVVEIIEGTKPARTVPLNQLSMELSSLMNSDTTKSDWVCHLIVQPTHTAQQLVTFIDNVRGTEGKPQCREPYFTVAGPSEN